MVGQVSGARGMVDGHGEVVCIYAQLFVRLVLFFCPFSLRVYHFKQRNSDVGAA